ncbi:MAG: FAD-binding oxidoreductase [Syntrophotaleaceae bacterium]
MIEPRIIRIIEDIVGTQHVSTADADRLCYSYDATQRQHRPDAVVWPSNTEEISLPLKMANAERIPVYPRGAGSGFTGGSLPIHGPGPLVLTRLNAILRIDEANLIAEVEPGVATRQLQKAVKPAGCSTPDPASLKFSTPGRQRRRMRAGDPAASSTGSLKITSSA